MQAVLNKKNILRGKTCIVSCQYLFLILLYSQTPYIIPQYALIISREVYGLKSFYKLTHIIMKQLDLMTVLKH